MAEIKNMPQLLRKFSAMEGSIQAVTLQNALIAGGMLIVNDAKEESAYISGTQARSIHIGGFTSKTADFAQGGDSPYSDIGSPEGTRYSQSIRIGTNVTYAKKNEYNHKAFLRPAFDSQKEAAVVEVGEALADLVRASAQ
jgi:hypothetical protein